MMRQHRGTGACLGVALFASLALLSMPGCDTANRDQPDTAVISGDVVGETQESFTTPEAAADALVKIVGNHEKGDLAKLFGPAIKELGSGDPVEDKNDYNAFALKAREKTRLEKKDEFTYVLHLGQDDWPFAIPIVKSTEGKWFFDTQAGKAEILARRVGANELAAIHVCHAYVQAQREYASKSHDNSDVVKYAQRLLSHPGQQDGLYWPSTGSADQSPFGPLAADAAQEGYGPLSGGRKNPTPYHGYYFHILKAQGPDTPEGQYSYVINGNMIAGFAFVAAPADYGQSGVMTFIVSHRGQVYQKDLGPKTFSIFQEMTEYNPDKTWKLVKE